MQELYYWIALRFVFGIGNVIYKNLIRHFGSPERIFQAAPEELAAVEGINARAIESIKNFKPLPDIDRELERIARADINIITFTSPEYPENLKNIYDPPPFLYVKGAIRKQDAHSMAVVGSRSASEYGMKVTEEISRSLAACGLTIISGMARGIDSCAHHGALAAGGRTIAVLGSGVDVVYPPENKKLYHTIVANGAVVSEYPMGTEPNSYNFPARNRIISGLSRGVLVVEASPKSGSLITARLALEQGRDVFAVPGNIFSFKSRGTNNLLRSGAKLVESARDILEELQIHIDELKEAEIKENEKIRELSPEQKKMFEMIQEEPVQIDELITKSGFSTGQTSSLLLELELNGLIRQLPGKRFIRSAEL